MSEEKTESSPEELKEKIHFLTDENQHLCSKLGSTQSKAAQHAASNRDLSSRLVQSEQDRLKISKDLVEAQIEANKLREKYEAEIFELQNKVLCQEGVVSNLEAELSRLKREVESASSQLQIAEGNERDIAEEYANLKSNFLTVSEGLEREITHSQELSDELLTLAHTHDTLLLEKEREHTHTLELERVKALLSRMSQSRVRLEELGQGCNATGDRHTHKAQYEMREELERMRKSYEEQQHQLEEKIASMGKDQQENKRAIRNTQQDLAHQSATLLVSQHYLKEVEAENSKLQNQLKELNQEYRSRLTHYIHDITECVRRHSDTDVQLKEYVDSMLKEVRVSYRSREEQLTSTLRNYRKRLHNLSNTHQLLLTAYRMQREQILVHTGRVLEAGPPEAHFSPADVEIRGETERELQRLREDKSHLETQLRIAQEQVSLLSQSSQNVPLAEEAWADIRKQLREIAVTAQETHERERAQLITRATVAEEQVRELQEYVDNHLGRYKLEVTRLRRMLRFEAGRSQSAEAPKPRPLQQSHNATSDEL
ncbi:coiled-coil domain-containing protein 78-like [Tachysurus fulvidraco]|uniref:coiled-coil domain-containing protein 78-like n=1 Tax=Tachysurus fulvidraco TaxID=1234273 RepID=UPI001FED4E34|nr:coiled-coil domain-containing protein 78-like [Tachysurus fulvidraco]